MKKRWFMLIPVVAAVLSLSLLAAACGDDDGGGGDETPTATEATETSEATAPDGTPEATDDGTPSEGTTIDVGLDEFSVTLSAATAAAGDVTFDITNDGTIAHELIVVKTELAADALPVNEEEFIVDESGLDVIGEVEEDVLTAGANATLTEHLDAGDYVLFCNVASHYESGMTTAFTVE